MKRLLIVLLVSSLFVCLSQTKVYSQERGRPRIQREGAEGPFREGFEIRRKMQEIERQAIESDPELKKLQEQIDTLQKQLREKLQQKLSTNSEYQELKQKMEQMQQMWRERARQRQEED